MTVHEASGNFFGVIAKTIDKFSVVINKGSDDGVKVGARFLVYGVGDEIRDPETGASLGILEVVRGTAKVTHLQPKMATLISDEYFKPAKKIKKFKYADFFHNYDGVTSETIEEDSTPVLQELDGPQVGDRVRPI